MGLLILQMRQKQISWSNMSHDIRTPMNAIIGMTAIALNNLDDKEKIAYSLKEYLHQADICWGL